MRNSVNSVHQRGRIPVFILLLMLQCSTVLSSRALIIVDIQNCFTGNGSLAIKGAEVIIPTVNSIREKYKGHFKAVFLTQDWHCPEHVSFASQHPNHKVYETVNLTYKESGDLCESEIFKKEFTVNCTGIPVNKLKVLSQTLWPDHCVQDTYGAKFHKDLVVKDTDIKIKKGDRCQVDSNSGFFDNGRFSQTNLNSELRSREISTVYVVGLALDICVSYTAKDAKYSGYTTYVIKDATAAASEFDEETYVKELIKSDVKLINSTDIENTFNSAAVMKFSPHLSVLTFLFVLSTRHMT